MTSEAPHKIQNHVFNHVAISVPNCDAACTWYQEVFGFRRIRSDRATNRAEMPEGGIFKIYPKELNKVNMAWLSAGNGVGFEVFEFQDPPYKPVKSFDFSNGAPAGFFHIAVTTPDPDATAKKGIELGGKQIGETLGMYGEKALYLADPWGNITELVSCSFEQLMGNRG